MVLFDNPVSSNALKVRFLLAELELDHERREVSLARPRPDWYLQVNPLGGVPAIDDDGFRLAESHAILRYLARRQGRADLYPAAAGEQARVDEFLDRFNTGIRAAFFRHEAPSLGYTREGGFNAAPPDPERAAAVAQEIGPTLRLLDELVSPDATVLGRFTIADCALAPVLFRTTVTGLDLSPFPTLEALRASLTGRESFRRADPVR